MICTQKTETRYKAIKTVVIDRWSSKKPTEVRMKCPAAPLETGGLMWWVRI